MTDGELAVLEFFHKHLEPTWEIYIQPHLNGLRPDFVLLNPRRGIAVFEVKDWNLRAMRYFTKKDRWGHTTLWAERDGVEFCLENQNPVTKVNLYKQEIFDIYCPRLRSKSGWAAITAGVIFPFARTKEVRALLHPFLKTQEGDRYDKYQPISGCDKLSATQILDVFPEAQRESSLMSEALAEDLRGWLVEPDFAVTQRLPLILDRNQRSLAESRTDSGYRRIKGPAGSGKSLVLAARAAKLANEGKSVLVAAFNITLLHYLRDLIVRGIDAPGRSKNVQLKHFHYWCKHVCYEVGWGERYKALWRSGAPREAILDELLPALANEAVLQPDATKYDAILVDEGQDYRPLWWNVLRKACNQEGEMLLVADATQDVYGTAKAWTDDVMKGAGFQGRWAQLSVSYRLPPDALKFAREFAERFLPNDSVDLPEQEQGSLGLYPCDLRWVQCKSADAESTCSDEIISLMRETGVNGPANADITLLSDNMLSGERITAALRDQSIETVDTFGEDHRRKKMGFYMGDARIKATTLHSFKGWEARMIVVYVSDAVELQSLALIYAGLTRLKRSTNGSWLTVVCSAKELNSFGSSWPNYVDRSKLLSC